MKHSYFLVVKLSLFILILTLFISGCSKESALFKAIHSGDEAKVEELLEGGVDVNCESVNGITPLMAAINDCKLEMFEILIDYGADVNAEDANGMSVQDYAMKSSARDCPYKFENMILKHEDYQR